MRVQRAPRAAEQPQRPPAGTAPARTGSAGAGPAGTVPKLTASEPFSAEIELDLTPLAARLEPSRLVGEIVVLLVEACRAEGLIDEESPLRVVRTSDGGLVGQQLEQAVRQSAFAVSLALDALLVELPPITPRALTVVDLGPTPVRASGGWGLGGIGVVTFARPVPTVVSHPLADGSGLGLAHRQVARLGFVVPDAPAQAPAVVRVLNSVARSVEQSR